MNPRTRRRTKRKQRAKGKTVNTGSDSDVESSGASLCGGVSVVAGSNMAARVVAVVDGDGGTVIDTVAAAGI